MITRIEALHYRALRYVSQRVGAFQVLVGPNASGKSTFLDIVAFLGDLLQGGLVAAVQGDPKLSIATRAPNPNHLVWLRQGTSFELAVELAIPEERRQNLPNGGLAQQVSVERCTDGSFARFRARLGAWFPRASA